MSTDLPERICATCRQALQAHINPLTGARTYGHAVQDADHRPVPIEPPADWLGRCDFCNVGIPEFVLPVASFTAAASADTDWASAENWAACHSCAALIEKNDWNGLVRAADAGRAETTGAGFSAAERAAVAQLYRQVRRHVRGALRPLG